MTDSRKTIGFAIAAIALVAVGGWWYQTQRNADEFAQCRAGISAGDAARLGAAFTLTDENGQRVSDTQVFTKPSLLYFGYTFCPDVCPMDNARNAAAVDILTGRGLDVQPVFISVDPRRDTPERLAEFTDVMHPAMLGLTGTAEEIAAVTKAWRYFFKINDQQDKEFYLIDHMTNTYLVMPGRGTVETFARDTSPEEMAERTACFVDAASGGAR